MCLVDLVFVLVVVCLRFGDFVLLWLLFYVGCWLFALALFTAVLLWYVILRVTFALLCLRCWFNVV